MTVKREIRNVHNTVDRCHSRLNEVAQAIVRYLKQMKVPCFLGETLAHWLRFDRVSITTVLSNGVTSGIHTRFLGTVSMEIL